MHPRRSLNSTRRATYPPGAKNSSKPEIPATTSASSHQTNLADSFNKLCRLDAASDAAHMISLSATPPRCVQPEFHPATGRACRPHHMPTDHWIQGPTDAAGRVVNLSDRPNLCMSVLGPEAAVGSSDHAVYIVNIETGQFQKALYGKSYGHTEWVTCVDHLPDGRIISGGMDSKLCLWERTGVRCVELKGHTASISAVKVDMTGSIAVSSSYDKSLLLWDLRRSSRKPVRKLQSHRAAVMVFSLGLKNGIASGGRDGDILLWDGGTGSLVLHCKSGHRGHVTAIECLEEEADKQMGGAMAEVFLSGGQDGVLQVWDFRIRSPVHSVTLHRRLSLSLLCVCL